MPKLRKRARGSHARRIRDEPSHGDAAHENYDSYTTSGDITQIVEIRDAQELIADERNRFNKSLATLIRKKSPRKVPKAERKTG